MNQIQIMTVSIIILATVAAFTLSTGFSFGSIEENNTPGYKEFTIVMRNNRYNPSQITVNQGDRVVIDLINQDSVAHGVGIPEFNTNVPGGHVFPGNTARLEFIATTKTTVDAATCGGFNPTDKTDDHGEELIVTVI